MVSVVCRSFSQDNAVVDSDSTGIQNFGGPQSVAGQLSADQKQKSEALSGYFGFKSRLQSNTGLAYGIDWNPIVQAATSSLGEDVAASGAFRVFGTWSLVGNQSGNKGSLVFKFENRHRLGTDIPAQGLGSEIGYVGLTAVPFSDIGWALTNLYWNQQILQNKLAFVIGVLDPADYTNVYGLVDPWSDFYNLTFSTGPTVPLPNQGLGAAVRGTIAENWYILAGISDANGDPTKPGQFFNSFFNTGEYFSQVEVGWISSYSNRFSNNIHLNYWNATAREEAGTLKGWGLAFSASQTYGDHFEPFVRIGYGNDGGALLSTSVAIGTGYGFVNNQNKLGIGLGWGDPMTSTFGQELEDQFTLELYYRFHLLRIIALTPDIQLLFNPALNPDKDFIAVFGLRARISI